MKITFFSVTDQELPFLYKKLDDKFIGWQLTKLSFSTDTTYPEETISISSRDIINNRVLDCFPNLKLIITRSTGTDHIDVDECTKRKIMVINIPDYGTTAVAEYTFALLLSLIRKIPKSAAGLQLRGKTLGVIGTGNIGRVVIKIAKGFGMKVLAFDKFPQKDLGISLCTYCSINELLQKSEFITLHVPATPETYHLINCQNVKLIKDGSFLINTSRSSIIDHKALIWGLKHNIAGAALDVVDPQNQKNLKKYNVLVTQHNAFNTEEALQARASSVVDSIIRFYKNL